VWAVQRVFGVLVGECDFVDSSRLSSVNKRDNKKGGASHLAWPLCHQEALPPFLLNGLPNETNQTNSEQLSTLFVAQSSQLLTLPILFIAHETAFYRIRRNA
jgi:hypothetical protein